MLGSLVCLTIGPIGILVNICLRFLVGGNGGALGTQCEDSQGGRPYSKCVSKTGLGAQPRAIDRQH
jgi:hypothetical protein